MEYDRLYKEHFEAQDAAEVDRQIEEAIIRANNAKTAEGEDEITDAEKDTITKESRFSSITKGFYAPDAAAEYRARQDKPGSTGMSGVMSSAAEARVQSAMSSVKESGQDKRSNADAATAGPPYTPLVPEQWQEKCIELGSLHVIKYKRIFQSLFYLLKFHDREAICQKETNNLEWKKCREFLKANLGAPTANLYK